LAPFSFKRELTAVVQDGDFYFADRARLDELYPADSTDWLREEDPDALKVWTARRFIHSPDDRAHLVRMVDALDIDNIAATIGVTSTFFARIFIDEVLSARRLAENLKVSPAKEHRRHADQADDLSRYLSGSDGRPPPLPFLDAQAIPTLKQVAQMLRAQAESSPYVSPQDSDGSRSHGTFIRLLSDRMLTLFGRLFAKEVADLANLAFERVRDKGTTAQDVYDARRQPERDRRK
jgi:hypothetical protein